MSESKASARRAAVAIRRGKALRMRAAGASYDEIWRAFPNDYRSRAAVVQDVQRALTAIVAEPAAELRALEAERLDMLWRRAMQVMTRTHITVSHGKVVKTMQDGRLVPLPDDGPVLAAIRELRMLSESRRKLYGADAAEKHEIVTVDAVDAEIKRLTAELDAADAADLARLTAELGAATNPTVAELAGD